MWLRVLLTLALFLSFKTVTSAAPVSCGSIPPFAEGMSEEKHIEMLLRRAVACVQEGRPDLSIEIFSEVIGLDPGNEVAYLNRGNAYLQMREFDLGISDFSHAISLDPKSTEAWYNRGVAFVVTQRYQQGIADLSEAIKLKPDFARAYCNRGLAFARKGDHDRALSDLSQGSQKDAGLPMCYFGKADVYFQRKDYKNAIEQFSLGLQIAPNVEALSKRGEAYEQFGKADEALADFKAALLIAPTHKPALEGVRRLGQPGR